MKIVQPEKSRSTIEHHIEDLKGIISNLSDYSMRACASCNDICATCRCNCSVECSKSADNLSSDAVSYPI
ncbi:MAG: hypothetical protein ACI9LM_001931 [Alteromonadaceae bacterium]|jgi:hypothetical protein